LRMNFSRWLHEPSAAVKLPDAICSFTVSAILRSQFACVFECDLCKFYQFQDLIEKP
jgi:hypothetical protein